MKNCLLRLGEGGYRSHYLDLAPLKQKFLICSKISGLTSMALPEEQAEL